MKNFIYLNDHKMYSLATQHFAGLAEALVGIDQELEGTAKHLAELFKAEQRGVDKRYVQDYAYTLFEKQLMQEQKVLELDPTAINEREDILPEASRLHFVKVTGKAVFIDAPSMISNLERFNKIGEAITFVTNYGDINRLHEDYRNLVDKVNQSSANKHMKQTKLKELERAYQQSTDIKQLVKNSNLHADQNFIESVSLLLDYGYKDQFEVQIKGSQAIFSSLLAKDYLREAEQQIVRRYAKISDRSFTLFGVVTQNPYDKEDMAAGSLDAKSIKEAVINLALQLSNVDTNFAGRGSGEIILDPIAVYTEI